MRAAFIEELSSLAEQDARITLVTGDLGFSVLDSFRQRFPNQFLNVGVAEQNMTGVTAGLALSGRIVFTYSIGNFPTMRCLEQIRNDVCYHNLPVTIVTVGGGMSYGALGYSHHAVEDLAIMRALPNMTVVAPGDPVETAAATRAAAALPGPCYLRLGRSGEAPCHSGPVDFEIGKAIEVRPGSDITLISTGGLLGLALEVAGALREDGCEARVLSMHTLKPLDEEALGRAAEETSLIVTLEEHSAIGGLGSAVAEALARIRARAELVVIGLPSEPITAVGDEAFLKKRYGLSVEGVLTMIKQLPVRQ